MSLGIVGCKKEEPADDKAKARIKAAEEAEKAKTEVKLKTATLELKAKAKDQKIEIEITEKAPEKIEFTVAGTDVSGSGVIPKDATKADFTITTEDAKDGVEVTFTAAGEKSKGAPKLKATIK